MDLILKNMALRLKSAVDLDSGNLNFHEFVTIANEMEKLALSTSNQVSNQYLDSYNYIENDVLTIESISRCLEIASYSMCKLVFLLIYNVDRNNSIDLISKYCGVSEKSVRVYICHLRSHLSKIGINDPIRSVYKSGYYITAENSAKIISMVKKHEMEYKSNYKQSAV